MHKAGFAARPFLSLGCDDERSKGGASVFFFDDTSSIVCSSFSHSKKMPRIDVWDLAKAREAPPIDAGFDPMDAFEER